jgi:two-component system, cell cycle sensor histidine kinase and response regulator CckA
MSFDSQSHPKTILVVDDDLSVLTVVKCMLEGSDYNVLLANSAEVALRMAERTDLTIDLMLIDVVMPDLSGPDLVERMLAIRPYQTVLFMSGFTDHEVVRVKVLDRGLRFLPKPFTPDGLLEAVQMVLSAPAQISDFRHRVARVGAVGR